MRKPRCDIKCFKCDEWKFDPDIIKWRRNLKYDGYYCLDCYTRERQEQMSERENKYPTKKERFLTILLLPITIPLCLVLLCLIPVIWILRALWPLVLFVIVVGMMGLPIILGYYCFNDWCQTYLMNNALATMASIVVMVLWWVFLANLTNIVLDALGINIMDILP